jgi:transposase
MLPRISSFFSPQLVNEARLEAEKRGLPLRVMFQDEARFGRITEPYACWAPPGFRPNVSAQIIREYTYLYGAISPKDGKADFLILPAMDGPCMNVFLEELSRRYPSEYLAIFWDGAPCHQPGAITIPDNIWLEKLPPKCPDLNPQENIWDGIRESFFANLLFDSMDAVESQLVTAANFYEANPKRIQSISGWDWIISTC